MEEQKNPIEAILSRLLIKNSLLVLDDRERMILSDRSIGGKTLEEIGKELNIRRQRVKQIEEVAKEKKRKYIELIKGIS